MLPPSIPFFNVEKKALKRNEIGINPLREYIVSLPSFTLSNILIKYSLSRHIYDESELLIWARDWKPLTEWILNVPLLVKVLPFLSIFEVLPFLLSIWVLTSQIRITRLDNRLNSLNKNSLAVIYLISSIKKFSIDFDNKAKNLGVFPNTKI